MWLYIHYAELKKSVIIDFIEDDIIMLQNAITLLNQSFPKRKNFSPRGFIRCFKRVDTTKLIVSMGVSCVCVCVSCVCPSVFVYLSVFVCMYVCA